jgi:exosortase A
VPADALKTKSKLDSRNLTSPTSTLFLLITGILVVHWATVGFLLDFWLNNFTYGHGLLVAPLSLYLIWRKRHQIDAIGYAPNYYGVAIFIFLNVVWLSAYLIDVEIVQQFALLSMIAALVLVSGGWRTTHLLLFPLLLPFIAMPIWSWLQPLLQFVTTQVVAFSLSLIGVPVFVETHFIRIPEGEFNIEEVCAGLRYLLAAVAISLVYVHLYIKKFSHAIVLLVCSIVLSMLVNWIRVFSVIVVGHLTNMQHSLVHHHASFGWWLFVFTLIPIFWLGNHISNKEASNPDSTHVAAQISDSGPWKVPAQMGLVVLGIVIIALFFPLAGYLVKKHYKMESAPVASSDLHPSLSSNWQGPIDNIPDNLKPSFKYADAHFAANYMFNGQHVFFFTAKYRYQEQGKELIAWDNQVFDRSFWRLTSKSIKRIKIHHKQVSLEVEENIVRNPLGKERLLWYWYAVGGDNTAKPVVAKMLIYKDMFVANKAGSSVVLLSCSVDTTVEKARGVLSEYLQDAGNIPGLD